jgi:hypothetical protein
MNSYETYLDIKKAREDAEYWNNLPKGRLYQNDTMGISVPHCGLKLTRAGQQTCGGNNYWEAPKGLSEAILEVIAENPVVIESALEKLRQSERLALIACEQETRDRLADIEKAKLSE